MGAKFDRTRLPAARDYFRQHGPMPKRVNGEGWGLVRCVFHDDHMPSLSLNIETGGYRCLACNASGGGVLDFHMARHGMTFEQAARDLGAWIDGNETPEQRQAREQAARAAQDARQRVEQARLDRERAAAERASWRAASAWYGAAPATADHPYLVGKQLPPCGARFLAKFTYGEHALANALLIGMRDTAGQIKNVQGIGPDGAKRFMCGAPTHALFAPVIVRCDGKFLDPGSTPEVIGVAEGWASAVAFALVRKAPVVAAMSAMNIPHVAVALRQKWPGVRLLIAHDNDEAGAKALGTTWGLLLPPGRPNASMEAVGIASDSPAPIFNDWADHHLEVTRGVA